MKYVLLGGAGFIGQHLAKALLENEENEVVVIDSLVTSEMPKHYTIFIQSDISKDSSSTLDYFIKYCDIVYFLSASVGVEHIDKNPTTTLRNNIEIMQQVVPLLEKHKKKVVFASSSEVYGDGPFNEDNNLSIGPPTVLRWGYASAKLMTEFMIAASNIPYIIVRFFNVVGPGQLPDYGMVLPRFVESAKNNNDIIVHGSGNQVRSFCHVNDAVAFLQIVEEQENEIYNIGNDEPITIHDLAEKVIEITHSKSKIKFVPYEEVFSKNTKDINYRVPDINKIKKLGYEPKYDLSDIIKDML